MAGITLLAKISNLTTVGKGLLGKTHTKIGELILDASHSEKITFSNVISDHPTENGYYVTDNVYRKSLRFDVQGSIVDAPSNILGVATNVINLFKGNIFQNIANTLNGKGANQVTAYQALCAMSQEGTKIDVVGYWDVFTDMVVETTEIVKDETTGERLNFTITLKKATSAQVQFSNISHNSRSVQDLVGNKLDLGKRETKTPTASQGKSADIVVSVFKSIKSGIGF